MADEPRKRIPRLWLWVLAAAALVALVGVFWFVIVTAPALLIRHPPRGLSAADELKARNDVRTTLVQALAGLAVAGGLVVTYRTYRQNQAEQDRTYQLNQTEQQRAYERELHARAEQDRTYERELYAKAVEQLGHEKAPVRLGALYSLERLAEDRPERRQIIVNVICAYLRMPFPPPPPASQPEPEATEAPDARAAYTGTRTVALGDTWRQERQVRLTAQHILSDHLRYDRAEYKRSTDSLNPRFWPGIRIDLAGATLIDFNLHNSEMAEANFQGATFSGDAVFSRATFSRYARFNGAAFSGNAWFDEATFRRDAGFSGAAFSGDARFDGVTFSGDAGFSGVTFSGDAGFGWAAFSDTARFGEATFSGDAEFGEATFSRYAGFGRATFSRDAGFGRATFSRDAEFGGATFSGDTRFIEATFSRYARFNGVTFSGNAWFDEATFSRDAEFGGATFSGDARFDGATFNRDARFDGATFSGGEDALSFGRSRVTSADAQHVWPTGWRLGPDGTGGYTVVRANDGTF